MEIKRKSYFKDSKADLLYFESWVKELEQHNERKYERYEMSTSLGKTHVWGLNTKEDLAETTPKGINLAQIIRTIRTDAATKKITMPVDFNSVVARLNKQQINTDPLPVN